MIFLARQLVLSFVFHVKHTNYNGERLVIIINFRSSQGSAATQFRWGRNFDHTYTLSLGILQWKTFESVHIDEVMINSSVSFLELRTCMSVCQCITHTRFIILNQNRTWILWTWESQLTYLTLLYQWKNHTLLLTMLRRRQSLDKLLGTVSLQKECLLYTCCLTRWHLQKNVSPSAFSHLKLNT